MGQWPQSEPGAADPRWTRVQRGFASWRGQPTWLQRLGAVLVLLVVVGLVAALMVFGLVVGLVVAAITGVALLIAWVGRLLTGRRVGGGQRTDRGRRNVRVIVHGPE